MNRAVFKASILFILAMVLSSCQQDHIFFSISQEVRPIDPRISGTPTNIVELHGALYVASIFNRTIHQYVGGEWNATSAPDRIIGLAGTDNNLFALTGNIGSVDLHKWGLTDEARSKLGDDKDSREAKAILTDLTSWEWSKIDIQGHTNIQVIYAEGEYVFAGALVGSDSDGMFYSILSINETNNQLNELLNNIRGFLRGVAKVGETYYLATTSGIYTSEGSLIPINASDGSSITDTANMRGIIASGETVVAVSRRSLFLLKEGAFIETPMNMTFTGALGFWKGNQQYDAPQLLLLGVQASSTSHGYRELLFTNGAVNTTAGLREPGDIRDDAPSSTANRNQYNSSLRRQPLIDILQAPDGTIFAATLRSGLWSYRYFAPTPQWNAEE